MPKCFYFVQVYCKFLVFILFVFAGNASVSAQCPITVDAGPDLYLCAPTSPAQLDGSITGDFLNFMWTPLTGLQGANTLNPTVTVSQTMTYVLKATAANFSANVIVNGDFEGGNAGFSSDYTYNPGNLVPEGVYDVIDNPQSDHPGFAPCGDHTSGSGNMMVVNGAGTPGQDVWCQSVPVTPNTLYVFSCWVTSVVTASPALLQFFINGSSLGSIFQAPGQNCNWQNFYTTWNSGANSSATICVVNQNTVLGGNDFALDDIVFAPVCMRTDTVKVNVITVTAVATPAVSIIPCEGANVSLNGVGSTTGTNISYSWDSPTGNIVSGGTTLNPVVNAVGAYTLTVTYDNNGVICTKTATVNVILSPNPLSAWISPAQPLGCGAPTLTLFGNSSQPGFSSYQWTTPNGNIQGNPNQKNITVNQPGEYDLLVTNTATGCTATASIVVTAATNPPIANANVNGPLTCIQTTATLSGSGSSTGANISYAWTAFGGGTINSGATSQNAVAGSAGTFVLAVTNSSNGCISTDTVVLAANTTAPVLAIQPPGMLDCDTDTLSLSATATPVNAGLSWTASGGGQLISGQNTLNPKVITAGTYTLVATNPANGCTATIATMVTSSYTPPLAVVQPPNSLTCQSNSITLSGNGSSTGANFNYAWSGGNVVSGGNTLNPVVNVAATYTLLVTSTTNACTATASVTVLADQNVLTAIANAPDTITCTAGTVMLNATGSSTGATIFYTWSTTNGNINGPTNIPNPIATLPGTYQLLLNNMANGCTATDLAMVVQNVAAPQLQITIPAPGFISCANPTLSLQGQNGSLPGNFTYQWTAVNGGNIVSGATTLTPSVNTAGQYTLVATNLANGCTGQSVVNVTTQTGTPVIMIAAPGPLTCTTSTQVLNTGGSSTGANFSYAWTVSNGGNITMGATTPSPTVNAAGTYNLLVTNTFNGCTATSTVAVIQNKTAPPVEAGTAGLLTCTQPLSNLQANPNLPTANLVFLWSTSNGQFVGSPNGAQVDVNQAGLYSVLVTDPANGCTATDSVQVTVNQQPPTIVLAPPATLTCNQATATLSAMATGSTLAYQWQTTGGQIVSGAATAMPVVNAPGLYALTVTDGGNGCTRTASLTVIADKALPNVQAAPVAAITCIAPSQVIAGQNGSLPGNFTYNWVATNGGNIVSGNTSLMPTVNAGGDYTLTATNTANGCTSTVLVNVSQNTTLPTASAGPDNTLSCSVSSLIITGSGTGANNLTYAWTASNGGHLASGVNTPTPTIDTPGDYALIVANPANGCTATDVVTILNDANTPLANAGLPVTLTCTVLQSNLNATASQGANFSYQWMASQGGNLVSGATTLTPTVDAPGLYQLAVTNSGNGCVSTSTVTVGENITPPTVDAGSPVTLNCTNPQLPLAGTATGANNLTVIWTTSNGNLVSGASTLAPKVNRGGIYVLTATNPANGCTATDNVAVTVDTLHPVVSASTAGPLNCTTLMVLVNGLVAAPASGYTTSWTTGNGHFSGPQNMLSAMVDEPGTYQLSVQNTVNGCISSTQTPVLQDVISPIAQAGTPGQITCDDPTIGLDGAGSSAGTNFTYLWTAGNGGQIQSGQTTLNPTVSAAGTYSLAVTNNTNGCQMTATTTVTLSTTPPSVVILLPQTLTCTRLSVMLNAGTSSVGAIFTHNWTTTDGHIVSGQTTLMPTVDQPGNYLLTIENAENGCTATAQILVNENIAPPLAEAGPPAELHCKQTEVTLQGSSTTSGTLTFAWSTPDGHVQSGNATAQPVADQPGSYTVTVTDSSNGCTATDATTVTEVPLPAFLPTLWSPDCFDPTGDVDFGPVTGGATPFRYSTDGGLTFRNSPTFDDLAPGDHELIVEDNYGCRAQKSVVVALPFLPVVTLINLITLQQGDSVQLQPVLNLPPTNIALWEWTPADNLSCADCPQPWASPLKTVTYALKITDLDGCTASAKTQLRVNRNRNLYAPNVFSPNGDGLNDHFTLFGKGVKEVRALRIFDRWGAELFLAEHLQVGDEMAGWNGNFRGNALNPAVYVWQAAVEFLDGEVEIFSGDVTLMR